MTLISGDLRAAVVQRAGNRCEYCRLPQETQVATFPVDHIIPVSLGGATVLTNLALACPRCNARKWTSIDALDPVSGEKTALFHPRAQVWSEHFRWSEVDSVLIEPLTPTGRATVSLLDLNAPQHLSIRRWLRALGMLPTS